MPIVLGTETHVLPDGTEIDVNLVLMSQLVAVRPPASPPPPSIPTPAAYWPFNDSLADASGNSRDLTGTDITYGAGKFEQALTGFGATAPNRSNDMLTGSAGDGTYTIMGWANASGFFASVSVRFSTSGGDNLVRIDVGGTGSGVTVGIIGPGGDGVSLSGSNPGGWFHVAAVVDAGVLTLYVNGSSVGTGDVSGVAGVFSGTDALQVSPSSAAVDDLAIWNVALTPTQIATIANAPGPLSTLI